MFYEIFKFEEFAVNANLLDATFSPSWTGVSIKLI